MLDKIVRFFSNNVFLMHKPLPMKTSKLKPINNVVYVSVAVSNPVGAAFIINELRQNSTMLDKKTQRVFGSLS